MSPEASTCAIVGSELDHITPEAGDVLPAASVIVAEAWTDVPDAIRSLGIIMESEADWPPPLGAVEPDPPQAVRVSAIVATTADRFFCKWYLPRWHR